MTKEDCRLCFKTTLKPIGIFTPKGIKLNVANTVRTHFPDEVRVTIEQTVSIRVVSN